MSSVQNTPGLLCKGCHSVQYDKNRDGRYVKGTDLVLQTLWDEWREYAKNGGPSCLDCHMPVVSETRAAEAALVPLEQDHEAPARKIRDHSFVGPDSPIELSPERDVLRPAREKLLRRAATLESTRLSGAQEVRPHIPRERHELGHRAFLAGRFCLRAPGVARGHGARRNRQLVGSSGVLPPIPPIFVMRASSTTRRIQ